MTIGFRNDEPKKKKIVDQIVFIYFFQNFCCYYVHEVGENHEFVPK